MLKVDRVSACYDKVQALKEVSLEVNEKEIVTVIGANGAGKSTLLATVMGLVRPSGGTIEFLGRRIDRMETEDIVWMGLYLVPEGALTVLLLWPALKAYDAAFPGRSSRPAP